jgi:hypothetical protein
MADARSLAEQLSGVEVSLFTDARRSPIRE